MNKPLLYRAARQGVCGKQGLAEAEDSCCSQNPILLISSTRLRP